MRDDDLPAEWMRLKDSDPPLDQFTLIWTGPDERMALVGYGRLLADPADLSAAARILSRLLGYDVWFVPAPDAETGKSPFTYNVRRATSGAPLPH